eukprot:1187703-Prorocentrum_minimum.AAC.3
MQREGARTSALTCGERGKARILRTLPRLGPRLYCPPLNRPNFLTSRPWQYGTSEVAVEVVGGVLAALEEAVHCCRALYTPYPRHVYLNSPFPIASTASGEGLSL